MKINKTNIFGSIKLSRAGKMRTNCKEVQKDIVILSNCRTDREKHSLQKSVKENAYEEQI